MTNHPAPYKNAAKARTKVPATIARGAQEQGTSSMRSLRHGILAIAAAAWLTLSGTPAAMADDHGHSREEVEEMAREALEQLMQALELFIESIPQYEMPEINENGDIIIRRKRVPPGEDEGAPETDSTRT